MNYILRLAWRNIWRNRPPDPYRCLAMGLGIGDDDDVNDGLLADSTRPSMATLFKVLGGNIQIHPGGNNIEEELDPLTPLEDDQQL